jgi:hypothetical protein
MILLSTNKPAPQMSEARRYQQLRAHFSYLKLDNAAVARQLLNNAEQRQKDAVGVGSCTHSFAGDTRVLMADGSSKPIDQVKVGDKVEDSLPGVPMGTKGEAHVVTAVHVTRTDRDYTDVTVQTTQGPTTITGTANHPYWDATTRTWTQARLLRVGDRLQTSDGAEVMIMGARDHLGTMITYDLTVDDLHTYYIEAGDTPVLVHNDDPCRPSLSGVGDRQFGKKWGKHALDYGLDPGDPSARQWFQDRINEVYQSPDEIKQGAYNPNSNGGGTDFWFYRKGKRSVADQG